MRSIPDSGQGIEQLWRHERVIESLMDASQSCPCVTEADCPTARMCVRYSATAAMSSRPPWHGSEGPSSCRLTRGTRSMDTSERPLSGREYMLGRLAQHRSTTEIMDRLQSLGAFARASQMRPLRPPAVGVNGAYLMEPEAVEEFARRVSELAGSLE